MVRGALQRLGLSEPLAWVVAATFFHFASLHFLFATLPLYILDLGGSVFQVGLVVGVFAVASLGYLAIRSVPGLLIWRVFHAMGLAAFTTAAASLAGDLAAPDRRGTTMGIYGLAHPAALSVGPALGAAMLPGWGYPPIFLCSGFTAMLALGCVLPLPDIRPSKSEGKTARKSPLASTVLRAVVVPAALQFSASIAYGTIISFIAVVARERELAGLGAAFTLLALSSLGIRLVAGRAYDTWGPRTVLVPGFLTLAVGMALLAVTAHAGIFLGAAVLAGVGIGGTHTTLLARVIEGSPTEARGSAVAVFTSCWELGIGGGAIVMGRLGETLGFAGMYLVAAALCVGGVLGLRWLPGSREAIVRKQ